MSDFLLVLLSSMVVYCFCEPFPKDKPAVQLHHFFEHLPTLRNDGETDCPIQPIPVDLPSELPDIIKSALSDLSALGDSFVDSKTVPGVAIGLTYKGKTLWTKGFGVKDKAKPNVPPDADTIFRIGSVSKIFPVLMLYQLFKEGSIQSLDDPLRKYAPNFKINNPFSNSDITLRQMASQLSGLPREAPCGLDYVGLNICPLTNEEILKKLTLQYVLGPSWTRPSYSNLAYALLGNLIIAHHDRLTTFEEYTQDHILNPLQLNSTGFKITDNIKSQMAVGYGPTGAEASLVDLGYIAPAGQMYSTINDLNKLSQFFYEAYVILPRQLHSDFDNVLIADLRREMYLPYYINPDGQTGFGTPWEIMFRGNYTVRTKGGNINGYSALFSFIPELHLGMNALFSGAFDGSTFAQKAYDIILPAFVSYLSQQDLYLPFPPNPQIYIGQYNGTNTTVTVNIIAKDNKLYISSNSQQQNAYLAYYEVDLLQVYYPTNLLPCMISELLSELGEWLYFDSVDESGTSPGFMIPPVHFKRVA